MHLQGEIIVKQTIEQVWEFYSDITNLARWDHSVAQVIPTSLSPSVVGSTFDTISPSRNAHKAGVRMSYRIAQYVPNHQVSCLLIVSPMFKHAEWITTTEPVSDGVRITISVVLTVRFLYSFLVPVLLLTYKGAFRRDLMFLKQTMEGNS